MFKNISARKCYSNLSFYLCIVVLICQSAADDVQRIIKLDPLAAGWRDSARFYLKIEMNFPFSLRGGGTSGGAWTAVRLACAAGGPRAAPGRRRGRACGTRAAPGRRDLGRRLDGGAAGRGQAGRGPPAWRPGPAPRASVAWHDVRTDWEVTWPPALRPARWSLINCLGQTGRTHRRRARIMALSGGCQ